MLQLDHEWAALCRRPQSLATVRSWATRLDPDLAAIVSEVTSLDDLVASTNAGRGDTAERLLRELVRMSPDDRVAGQVVIQRLVPGMLTAVARYGRLCEHDDPVAEAVGALWIALASFDGERRRGPVAPSIISDAMFAAFRRRPRLKSAHERPIEPGTFDEQAHTVAGSPLAEFASVMRAARAGGVPADDLELLLQLVRNDSTAVLAEQRQVTTRAIRYHRTRAIARVREVVAA